MPERPQFEASAEPKAAILLDEGRVAEVALADEDAAAIRRRYHKQLTLTQAERTGYYRLVAPVHTGRVSLPSGALLVIRPKVPVSNLFELLGEAAELADFQPPPAGLAPDAEIFVLILRLFLAQVERLVAAGLYRDYRVLEDDLPLVRGRIMLAPQLRRHGGLQHRHVCSFADFSADNPENRVIAAALRVLPALLRPANDAELLARTRALLRHFAEVERVTPSAALALLPLISFHRLNAAYPAVLAVARLVLHNLTLVEQPGRSPLASFLIDMPRLFERYVAALLRRLLPALGLRAVVQRSDYLDEERRVSVRPDLLIYAAGAPAPALVLDTKYKQLDGSAGDDRSADIYQLNAYMNLYRLQRGALIYPRFSSDSIPQLQMRGSAHQLHFLTLDLGLASPGALREAVGGLAAGIAALAKQN